MVKRKKVLNLIEEKEAKLQELQQIASDSVQTVQNTIDVLDGVVDQMKAAEDEIEEYVSMLQSTGASLKAERERNVKIASNFRKLLCVE